MMDSRIKKLIAVGASVACNCHPCLEFHLQKARHMGIAQAEIQQAAEVGKMVRQGAAGQMDERLDKEFSSQKSGEYDGNKQEKRTEHL